MPTQSAAHANATHIQPPPPLLSGAMQLSSYCAGALLRPHQLWSSWSSDVLQAKEAVTGASFNGFDVASLQHNVRFGDLQSITGAQVPLLSFEVF